jgi:hypothetical protein
MAHQAVVISPLKFISLTIISRFHYFSKECGESDQRVLRLKADTRERPSEAKSVRLNNKSTKIGIIKTWLRRPTRQLKK